MIDQSPEDREKFEKMLEVIERNKLENLNNKQHAYSGLYSGKYESDSSEIASTDDTTEQILPGDVKIVVFGSPSPFRESISAMLQRNTVVASFDNPEKTIHFTLEYGVKTIVLDLDKPTESHNAVDIFSALKTVSPDIILFACTKNNYTVEARLLAFKGCIILQKPILRKQGEELLKKAKL